MFDELWIVSLQRQRKKDLASSASLYACRVPDKSTELDDGGDL